MARKKRTFGARLEAANAAVTQALEAFEKAASALDDAAEDAKAVVDEAEAEVIRLRAVRDDAYRQHTSYSARAQKIRELVR